MFFVQNGGMEASLPGVSGLPQPQMQSARVVAVGTLERKRQTPPVVRRGNQMHVIRHQAICFQGNTVARQELGNQRHVKPPVLVAIKDPLSTFSALGYVMRNPGAITRFTLGIEKSRRMVP